MRISVDHLEIPWFWKDSHINGKPSGPYFILLSKYSRVKSAQYRMNRATSIFILIKDYKIWVTCIYVYMYIYIVLFQNGG